jgi:RNA polymerase sigma-70 factor (ECF subfamily)
MPLDLARAGDPDAIQELYRLYGDTVFYAAYRIMGSTADAEDVAQDVFLGLPEALRTYASTGSLEGWIKRVTVRAALMKLRSRRSRREASLDEHGLLPGATTADCAVDRIALERALRNLPPHLRSVFVLKEVEGYSHAEVAEILGISIPASKIRLYRARMRLRQDLEVAP